MVNEEGFWLVWNPSGRAPTGKHPHQHSAEAEAKRLASANPGQVFYVLEAGLAFVKDDVKRIQLDMPLPF